MKHSVTKKPENHLLRNALGSLKLLRSLRNQNEGNKIVEKHTKYLNIKKKTISTGWPVESSFQLFGDILFCNYLKIQFSSDSVTEIYTGFVLSQFLYFIRN